MTAVPADEGDNLGRKAGRGVLHTLGGQWSRTLLLLVSTVVLARLLEPNEFGLLAMVTSVVGIADVLRDFGLTAAILQLKTISDRLWSMLFWLSLTFGGICMVLVAAASPLIAALYDEPRLVAITLILAPTLLLNGMMLPLQARLQRQLRFGVIAVLDVVSTAVGVSLAIVTALLGGGVAALIVLNVAVVVTRLIGMFILAKAPIGRPKIGREVRPILRSSSNVLGSETLNYLVRNLDNVVVGRFAGPAVLGFYGRAYSLLLLPLTQINGPLSRVALPVLSSLQDDPERYRRYLTNAILVISYSSVIVFAIAAAVADPLIYVFLGPGWSKSVFIFQLLAIAGVSRSLGTALTWIYISLQRTGRQLIYDLVTKPFIIASFFFGMISGGVHGMALAYGLTTLTLLIPGYYFALRGTFVRISDVAVPFFRPILLAPFMFAAALLAQLAVDLPPFVELMIGGFAGLVPGVLAYLLVPSVRRDLSVLGSFAGQLRKKRKPKSD
ncbi:lipopolysaccharide biosynthesis protein [Planctomonas psychrotolerans]|uniref:lipopolysaccharide biosynthesis protein n=1 Tax=Planctomonas psychrotolerans TaxID=2528712 RepID=UPI0012387935|nr:lipopolysaccharide biosynthesis protein [Planctomonas psychrotolerans]